MRSARSILIVEDEHALGNALCQVVRRVGHLPELAASGAAALDAFDGGAFAAVVLDIGLPDRSGLEILEELRARNPDLPVLVITAHATLDHAIRARQLGATGYLTKPLDLGQFGKALSALLADGPAVVPGKPVAARVRAAAAGRLGTLFAGGVRRDRLRVFERGADPDLGTARVGQVAGGLDHPRRGARVGQAAGRHRRIPA